MKVEQGEVFEYPGEGYVIIAEDKELDEGWEEVRVVWHKTEDLADYHPMEKDMLESSGSVEILRELHVRPVIL
jgi:hypothetical protein